MLLFVLLLVLLLGGGQKDAERWAYGTLLEINDDVLPICVKSTKFNIQMEPEYSIERKQLVKVCSPSAWYVWKETSSGKGILIGAT